MTLYDDITKQLRTAERGLSLLLDDIRVVLPEEREALSRAITLASVYAREEPMRWNRV